MAPPHGPTVSKAPVQGGQIRHVISNENNFAQAGIRWRSFDKARQQRFVVRVANVLNSPGVSKQLKSIWLGYWSKCDPQLGERIGALVNLSSL